MCQLACDDPYSIHAPREVSRVERESSQVQCGSGLVLVESRSGLVLGRVESSGMDAVAVAVGSEAEAGRQRACVVSRFPLSRSG